VIELRRIRANEGQRLRVLRLAALADAPDAFGTRLDEAESRPLASWDERARRLATSTTEMNLVAADGDDWCGLAGGYVPPEAPDTVEFVSLWVNPSYRRSGIATGLLEGVREWARERGAARVRLYVTETNLAARRLYVRAGFRETGYTEPLPSNPTLRELEMALDL